jgi:glycosyltransferase involved in cell wall biosynthesis
MNAIVEDRNFLETRVTTLKRLRVGLVISSLRAGGAERVASILADTWSAQGIDVTLLTFFPSATDFYRLSGAIRREVIGFVYESDGYCRRLTFRLQRAIQLRKALRKLRPDVLISFGHNTNLLVLFCAMALRIPVIVSERTDPRLAPATWKARWSRPWLYRCASAIVVQSHAVRKWVEQSLSEKTIRVIPNPVTPPSVDHLRCKEKRIVGMGRLAREKGFDLLIAAFARCSSLHPDWRLAIFGDGPEREALGQLAERLGVQEKVVFGGLIRETAAELASSEIFVLSSRFEGFPNVLLEAMSCGVAVVSFDCQSGPAEIISNGTDGILVPRDDVELLSASLSELMSDKLLRSKLGSNARKVVERYRVDKVSDMWCGLFAELVPDYPLKRESSNGTGIPE